MLAPELLLAAYRQGIFPMAVGPDDDIGWFSPDPRAIIPLDDRFHIPHGLRRVLKRNAFRITVDTAFREVIAGCADRAEGTWISTCILQSYCELHQLGHAHSLEVWSGDVLAGGLYGVQVGAAFCGESMFHRVTDASKVALVKLVDRLRVNGFQLLDTQWLTPHLEQFGALEIPRTEYLACLAQCRDRSARF